MAEEKRFENKIKNYLKEHYAWFIKYWGGAEFTKSGVPDILACYEGFFFGIEVKASRGKPSALQIYNLRKIHDAGGYAILLYPDDWDLFTKLIDNIDHYRDGLSEYDELAKRWMKYE